MIDKVQEARDKAEQAQRDLEKAKQNEKQARINDENERKRLKEEGIAKVKQAMREAVLAEVVKLKPDSVLQFGRIKITEDGYEESISIGLVNENENGYRANGKIRLTISRSYGDTKQFPQKKDGTHSYTLAAEHVAYLFDVAKRNHDDYKKRADTRAANKSLVERLNAEFGEYSVKESEYQEGQVSVEFKIHEVLTEEQAREVLSLKKELKAKIAAMKEGKEQG